MFDALVTFVIRVMGAGFAFALQTFLARIAGPSDFGAYVLVWTWLLSIGSVASLGLAETSLRFLPRYAARGNDASLRQFFNFGNRTVASTSLLLCFLALIAVQLLAPASSSANLIAYIAIGTPLLAIEYFLEGASRAMGWFRFTAVCSYVLRPIIIIAIIAVLYWFGVGVNADVICRVLLCAMAVTSSVLFIFLTTKLPRAEGAGTATEKQKTLWMQSSLPAMAVAALDDLLLYTDVLLVGLFLGSFEAGLYYAAGRVLILAGFVQHALYFVFGRKFSAALAAKDRVGLQTQIAKATWLTIGSTILVVAGAIVAGPLLLQIFGNEFTKAYFVLIVLAAGLVARALSGQAQELLMVMGRYRSLTMINAAALIVALGLLVILLPIWGAAGAALAMALAFLLRSLAYIWTVHRLERLNLFRRP